MFSLVNTTFEFPYQLISGSFDDTNKALPHIIIMLGSNSFMDCPKIEIMMTKHIL